MDRKKAGSLVVKNRMRAVKGGTRKLKRLQSSINCNSKQKCNRNEGDCERKNDEL